MHMIVIIIYLIGMLLIGVLTSKKSTNLEDFFVANRQMPLWVNVNTIAATYIGAGATMGIAGYVYRGGVGGAWILYFQVLAMMVLALVMSKKLWETKAITLADVVEKLYDPFTRQIVTLMKLISLCGVVGSQLLAMALIGQVVMGGVPFLVSLLVMTGVIVLYTVMGGLMAVALTDVVQMILNALGVMVILPLIGLIRVGGLAGLQAALPVTHFQPLAMGWKWVFAMFVFGVPGVFIAEELWVRLFAAKTPRQAKLALSLGTLGVYLPYALSVTVVGLVGRALFPGVSTDGLIPLMLDRLAPGIIASVCLASLLAAVMSCADSVLLVAGSNISRDVYQRFINPKANDKQIMLVSRLAIVLVGAIGVLLAYKAKGIIDLMMTISTPMQALGPIVVIGFYWKRMSPLAAKAAIAVALALSVPMLFFKVRFFGLEPIVVTFCSSIITCVVMGLLFPRKAGTAAASPTTAD